MKILVACEVSGIVRDAFRSNGHDAWSCDLVSSDSPYHIQEDVLSILEDGWDLMIAHPPCTYLCTSGAGWFYHPDDSHLPVNSRRPHPLYPDRKEKQEKAVSFFMKLVNALIPYICMENPAGIMSTIYRKPSQILQPYMFGDRSMKRTCLWLKNLPLLRYTEYVSPIRAKYVNKKGVTTYQSWDTYSYAKKGRGVNRSITYPGIAKAMADQWNLLYR